MRIKTSQSVTVVGAGVIVAAALALTACSSSSHHSDASGSTTPMTSSMMTSMSAPGTMTQGDFMGLNGKKVGGHAAIAGNRITLTGYSSDEGPDLHLYLANGTTENDVRSGVEISKVSYNTASQTFTLPVGVNASSYQDLVVHCDKALAVFGAAKLMQ